MLSRDTLNSEQLNKMCIYRGFVLHVSNFFRTEKRSENIEVVSNPRVCTIHELLPIIYLLDIYVYGITSENLYYNLFIIHD